MRIIKSLHVRILFKLSLMTFVLHKKIIMENNNNLEQELETNENRSGSNDSTGETETPKTQGPTQQTTTVAPPPTTTVDPPPTTSPEGAGEVIKPIEGRERNPKKR